MNELRQVSAEIRRLSSAEAELWIRVEAEQVTPTTEVRGRMIGPRCLGVTTVEVAYPLQQFPRQADGLPPLSRRVVIPDPTLWEPERPFVYHAIVELWQDSKRCDLAEFDYGLRMASGTDRRQERKD
jgi:hypothetical protein